MKRTVCLVLIFLLAQLLSSLAVLFFFNLPALLQDGHLEMGVLAESPTAISVSLILNAVVMWAVMTLLRWTDRRSFRWQGYGWKLYVIVLLGMVPVIFLVNLLLESLALEDWNAAVFGRMVRHPLGVLALVLVGPFMEELVCDSLWCGVGMALLAVRHDMDVDSRTRVQQFGRGGDDLVDRHGLHFVGFVWRSGHSHALCTCGIVGRLCRLPLFGRLFPSPDAVPVYRKGDG